MKYVPPLGATDPNASYQDGNPEAGIFGSIVPAAAIERPQREILNVLTAAGLTPSDTDLTQLLAAIRKIIGTQNAELERLRLLKIGCPMYWRSTTLPENFAWVNGDLVLFEDWPEFAAVYNAGGFSGMVLPYDADSATIAANLGKFRPNAANPTGLYLPSCGEQFFRAWTLGAGREAGSWQQDAVQPGFTQLLGRQAGTGGGCVGPVSASGGVTLTTKDTAIQYGLVSGASELAMQYTWKSTQRTADETHPVNVAFPVCLYLGLPA